MDSQETNRSWIPLAPLRLIVGTRPRDFDWTLDLLFCTDHWSSFVIKQTYKTLRPKESFVEYHHAAVPVVHGIRSIPHGWEWFEMVFFVHWTPPHHTTVICFDTPGIFQDLLYASLSNREEPNEHFDPYSLFLTVLYEVVSLYSTSVWTMRNHVCSSEAVSKSS